MSGMMKDPVAGTATVVSYQETQFVNEFDTTIKAQLVVAGEGLEATPVELNISIPKSQLPLAPNTAFQVHIDRANPRNISFDQEDPQQSAEDGRAAAEQLAAQMRGQTPGAAGTPGIQILGANSPDQAAQAIATAEQTFGMDLDGDGKVGGAGSQAAPSASAGGNDTVSKLEKLAKLHESGALTDAEFDTEKKRVLDSD
jgi:hypothetical protein